MMNIRYKLSLQFTLIVFSILLIFTIAIFYFSSAYRENDYYSRLNDRAFTTARLLLDVKEVDETLLKIIDKNTLALNQEIIFIFDKNDKQIYSTIDDNYNNINVLNKIRQNGIYKFREGERDAIGILYNYNNQDYIVVASALDIYGIAKIKNLRIILISGLLLSLIITVIAGLIFSGRALDPISSVISQVNEISISNLNMRVDEGNRQDEIAQLAITFNQMLQRLEEAFKQQRDFVSNAAHELRTPLTVLLAEIDFCLMLDRDKERYLKTLNNLSSELKKLSKLSNGLLDLASISYDISNLELRIIRVDELLVETCNDLLNRYKDYKINIRFDDLPENDALIKISGNEPLLKIAIKNIIENACKFSSNKSVDIFFQVQDNTVRLNFTDKGIGIPEEDTKNIFEPFFRGNNTHYIAGYGIGLALTKKIIQLHHGGISVKSQIDVGSEFILTLPSTTVF